MMSFLHTGLDVVTGGNDVIPSFEMHTVGGVAAAARCPLLTLTLSFTSLSESYILTQFYTDVILDPLESEK